ncbi:MAG: hypothetical protein OQK63_11435 [Ignavibacteriaceae bacterium]|nr:hypothetical protein [Ignavibacteriaceae bacterium]
MIKLLIGLFLISPPLYLQAQTVKSYEINAEFFPDDAQMYNSPVSPEAFMRANSFVEFSEITDSVIVFYLHGELNIDSILSGNKNINYSDEKVLYGYDYSRVALKVIVRTSDVDKNNLNVFYSGFFNPSKVGAISNYMHINKNSGVYLRGYGYSLWFPVFAEAYQSSYKADFRKITVQLPREYKCIVGGELLEEKIDNSTYTAIWKPGLTDILDIQCTARPYQLNTTDNVYVYYLDNQISSEKILEYAIGLRKLYSQNLKSIDNALPLFIMEMPRYGDISSGNVIGISEEIFNTFENDIRSKSLIAHELVHPYVKIPVTKENPFCAFVIEGFPSFFQVYALKKMEGDAYDAKGKMMKVEEGYLEKRKTGKTWRGNTLPVEKPILEIKFDEIGLYKDKFVLNDRVWLFFYSIWNKMGDEEFDRFLKELFSFNSINYNSFEELVVKYIPGFAPELNTWLNTTDYPDEIKIVK